MLFVDVLFAVVRSQCATLRLEGGPRTYSAQRNRITIKFPVSCLYAD
jgi:hypothetical protein